MLNWLARYAPLRDLLLADDGRPRTSVLDVGCGPHGLACAFPEIPFVGTDVLFPGAVAPTMVGVRSRPGPLPFADGAFGTVLCLVVLEHVPSAERAGFVAELTRVAAERVILACPSDEAQGMDDFIRALVGEPMPVWLAEHYECGLPSPKQIARCSEVPGFTARPIATSNGLLAALIALGDMLPVTAHGAAVEFSRHRAEWIDLFATATFGDSFRKAWSIERVEARTPLVGRDCGRPEVAAALRCPDCAGAHRDLVCTGCGRRVTVDATGAWDLADPAPTAAPALDTDAGTILWLAPAWERPETWVPALAAYIELTRPEDDCCLVLHAPGVPAVADAVVRACDDIAGAGDYGDILLVDAPMQRPERAHAVDGPAMVAAAIG
jgi:SAM-dependent methyltransferase